MYIYIYNIIYVICINNPLIEHLILGRWIPTLTKDLRIILPRLSALLCAALLVLPFRWPGAEKMEELFHDRHQTGYSIYIYMYIHTEYMYDILYILYTAYMIYYIHDMLYHILHTLYISMCIYESDSNSIGTV